jgi:hypothetical protein
VRHVQAIFGPKKLDTTGLYTRVVEDRRHVLLRPHQPVQVAGREMIVLELYRRGTISSGKAAELLGMPRIDFIKHASRLGIPYIDMTEEEWAAEKAASESL